MTAWIRQKIALEVVIAFVLGIVLGLVVLGWWLWPVQWTNADLVDLKPGHKESYLQMVADSYALSGNLEAARVRLAEVKHPGDKDADMAATLDRMMRARLAANDPSSATRLQALASVIILPPLATPKPTPGGTKSTGWIWAGALGGIARVVGIVFFLLLLGGGLVLLLPQLQRRESLRRKRQVTTGPPPGEAPPGEGEAVSPPPTSDKAKAAGWIWAGALGHFETTYNLGDEGYDVSYSIQSGSGEFRGECGVSALENLGIGEPGAVAAFEVWLFDKDDVRTESRVLMSERALQDPAIREKLEGKGELIKAEKGLVVTVETANLRVDATVSELSYQDSPDSGIFARLTTTLEVSHR